MRFSRGTTVTVICYWMLLLVLSTWSGESQVHGFPMHTPNSVYEEYKCRDTITGREMFVGEVLYRRGVCVRAQCLGNLKVWEDRCQVPNLEGNCSEIPPANEYLDYPKCCPLYVCKLFMNDDGQTEETRIYDHYGNRKSTYVTQVFTRVVDNGAIGNNSPVITQVKL